MTAECSRISAVPRRIHKQALTTGGSVPVPVDDVMTADGIRIRYYKDPAPLPGALYSVRSD